ncbi:hypothetical protein K0M31_011617 [Melipona bicolor]|uniref:Uncharacterized protein n=1 Tax=Melipona bicolor TaxID=60889 RepID=A0AA40G9W6_9HYME|nr:hypothetical protein K0M31_011617 [Melipona bicolor]
MIIRINKRSEALIFVTRKRQLSPGSTKDGFQTASTSVRSTAIAKKKPQVAYFSHFPPTYTTFPRDITLATRTRQPPVRTIKYSHKVYITERRTARAFIVTSCGATPSSFGVHFPYSDRKSGIRIAEGPARKRQVDTGLQLPIVEHRRSVVEPDNPARLNPASLSTDFSLVVCARHFDSLTTDAKITFIAEINVGICTMSW